VLTCLPLDIVMIGIGMEPRLRLGRILRVFSEGHLLTVRKVQKARYVGHSVRAYPLWSAIQS
jgi:hypothetical protein